jgi:hypothetical protein
MWREHRELKASDAARTGSNRDAGERCVREGARRETERPRRRASRASTEVTELTEDTEESSAGHSQLGEGGLLVVEG